LCTTPKAVQAFAYTSQSNGLMTGHIYIHDNFIRRAGRGVVYGGREILLTMFKFTIMTGKEGGILILAAIMGDGLMIGNPDGNSCSASKNSYCDQRLFHTTNSMEIGIREPPHFFIPMDAPAMFRFMIMCLLTNTRMVKSSEVDSPVWL